MGKKGRKAEEAELELASDPRSMQPWQIRQRLRRGTQDPEQARIAMGGKAIEEWDHEELARGRPRNKNGTFSGAVPAWVTEELQEEAARRFKRWLRNEMARQSIPAMRAVADLVEDAESDRVRLDAAKFLLEHVVGKPQQEVTGDIRMNIQHLLANVLVTPEGDEAIDAEIIDDDDDSDDWSDDED